MRDDDFEWDDRKAAQNLRKHGVSFDEARRAFDHPDGVDEDDPDPDEERYKRLCELDHRILVVIWTNRGKRIRIISARPASKHERQVYIGREA